MFLLFVWKVLKSNIWTSKNLLNYVKNNHIKIQCILIRHSLQGYSVLGHSFIFIADFFTPPLLFNYMLLQLECLNSIILTITSCFI